MCLHNGGFHVAVHLFTDFNNDDDGDTRILSQMIETV